MTQPYKALEIKSEFDELIRASGLSQLAAEAGHVPLSHTDTTLKLLLTVDERLEDIKARVRKLADKPLPILIIGETGTGKELIANALHGSRKPETFVAINCGAIPSELLESELFGSKKGSFTGALDRAGMLERAKDGTLFLDEIGEMPRLLQCKLLRVLQEKTFRRVGDTAETRINFRLVSATNQLDLLTKDTFRDDLYYRLAGHIIHLPPLRERHPQDIPLICSQFAIHPSIAEKILLYCRENPSLPGNVRELINLIEEANALL